MASKDHFIVDRETFDDLNRLVGDMFDFYAWLSERGDREAFAKFKPIVNGMLHLIMGIIEGAEPGASELFDAMNALDDEIYKMHAQAEGASNEEAAAIFATIQAGLRDIGKRCEEAAKRKDEDPKSDA